MEFIIKLSGVFLGVLSRMIIPYIRKLKQKKIARFNNHYFRVAICSFMLSFIVTLLIFPQFSSTDNVINLESGFKLFCIAFGFGFGFNSLVSELSEWGDN